MVTGPRRSPEGWSAEIDGERRRLHDRQRPSIRPFARSAGRMVSNRLKVVADMRVEGRATSGPLGDVAVPRLTRTHNRRRRRRPSSPVRQAKLAGRQPGRAPSRDRPDAAVSRLLQPLGIWRRSAITRRSGSVRHLRVSGFLRVVFVGAASISAKCRRWRAKSRSLSTGPGSSCLPVATSCELSSPADEHPRPGPFRGGMIGTSSRRAGRCSTSSSWAGRLSGGRRDEGGRTSAKACSTKAIAPRP